MCAVISVSRGAQHSMCNVAKQVEGAKGFVEALESLVTLFRRAEREGYTQYGLWHERGSLSYADVMAAPCELRSVSVLKPPTLIAAIQGSFARRMC